MKRVLSFLIIIILTFSLIFTSYTAVLADESGDFNYFITDYSTFSIASISSYLGKGGPVTIPQSFGGVPVAVIDSYAFQDCKGVTSVIIPSSVTNINRNAFLGCTGLTSVDIGNNVTTLSLEAFEGCTKLTQINVDVNNPAFSSVDGVLFNKLQTTLLKFPYGKTGNYLVKNTVTSIGDFSFHKSVGLKNLVISESVNNIGAHAFNYSSLTGVIISSSVSTIGEFAFAQATNLVNITIGSGVNYIGKYAFNGCKKMVAASFQGNAPLMGSDVFARCASAFKVYYITDKLGFTNPWKGSETTNEVYIAATPTPPPTQTPAPVSVTSVKIIKSTLKLGLGKTTKLLVTVLPVDASNKKVTWKSSNTKYVSVGLDGTIKGVKKGSAYIYVFTVDGKKSSNCKVTIS